MIAIVDYGLGNIQAIANIYKRLGIPICIASTSEALQGASKIILPGVGAFDWAMSRLNQSGLRACLDTLVLQDRIPVLGICVGMQMMATRSDEGVLAGLGWIEAEVKRFDVSYASERMRLPHMGWNDAFPITHGGLFEGLDAEARFYFLHSYYFAPRHNSEMLASTDYNGPYASSVQRGNVYGVQFHPEKSHQWGIRLLKNFAEL